MADSGFLLDDVVYEVPSLDTLDMDECELLYNKTGLTVEDFVQDPRDKEAQALVSSYYKRPALQRALALISYLRKNEDVTQARADELIGKVKRLELFSVPDEEEDARPPDLESSGSSEKNEPSGESSTPVSEEPESQPAITGTTR